MDKSNRKCLTHHCFLDLQQVTFLEMNRSALAESPLMIPSKDESLSCALATATPSWRLQPQACQQVRRESEIKVVRMRKLSGLSRLARAQACLLSERLA